MKSSGSEEIKPKPGNPWKWILGFNYFNLMDALLTLIVTQRLGGYELNPFMAVLLDKGPMYFFSFKMLIGIFTTIYLVRKQRFKALMWFTFLFAAVVLWNVGQLFRYWHWFTF